MSATLELERVSFSYGPSTSGGWSRHATDRKSPSETNPQTLLADLDLLVAPGELTALLGANGSGKTTLLRLASGVLEPQIGRVLLDRQDVRRIPRREYARSVSVLSQETQPPHGWTVREVVSLGRTPHIGLLGGESEPDRAAIDEALRITASCELADRQYDTLSGGQRQRVMVALAVAQQPRLLLLDEPTAHLDLKYRAALLDAVTDLRERLGLTVLAAMHDPSLAALYFTRLLLMSGGRIIASGPAEEVLTEPLLEEAYGAPVRVTHDPELGVPIVTVLPTRRRDTRPVVNKVP